MISRGVGNYKGKILYDYYKKGKEKRYTKNMLKAKGNKK